MYSYRTVREMNFRNFFSLFELFCKWYNYPSSGYDLREIIILHYFHFSKLWEVPLVEYTKIHIISVYITASWKYRQDNINNICITWLPADHFTLPQYLGVLGPMVKGRLLYSRPSVLTQKYSEHILLVKYVYPINYLIGLCKKNPCTTVSWCIFLCIYL